MTEFVIPTWFLWALGIAIAFSIGLNGGPFLPWFRDLRPSRIEARWVGYVGLTVAFWAWIILNPLESVSQAGVAWLVICLSTLIPNTLIHLYRRDHNNNDPPTNNGDDPHPVRTQRRYQALVENIVAANHDLMEAAEIIDLALQALYDPKYIREHDPDEDAVQWKKEAKKGQD
jgi:hypothetical protein